MLVAGLPMNGIKSGGSLIFSRELEILVEELAEFAYSNLISHSH